MIRTSEQAYRRDRCGVLLGMAGLSLLSWVYMIDAAKPAHQAMAMPVSPPWDQGLLGLSLVMWSVMMIAMMLPSATPMVLSFTRVQHGRQPAIRAVRLIWLFVGGYLLAWIGFSLVAAVAQWALYSLGLMSSAMGRATPFLGGVLLMGAGLYQWSGLKDACLTQCQSPLSFLLNQWRPGGRGALIMGVRHGLFCIGCCWLLMLLMFAGGVMNLVWMAAIALYVLAEKLLPWMQRYGRAVGILLVVFGVMQVSAVLASGNLSGGTVSAYPSWSVRLTMDYCKPDPGPGRSVRSIRGPFPFTLRFPEGGQQATITVLKERLHDGTAQSIMEKSSPSAATAACGSVGCERLQRLQAIAAGA